jgi:hypothetical protein
VFKINKAIYGLKQASRQWFKRFHDFIHRQGFHQSEVDPCLYTKHTSKGITLVAIYVDDLLIASNSSYDSIELQAALSAEFQMKHLGSPTRFLGIQLQRTSSGFLIHQADLIDRILQRFGVTDVEPASTPMDPKIKFDKCMSGSPSFHGEYRHAVGCLQYLVTCSRPDIAAPVSILSAYNAAPTVAHWEALLRVLAYLKGTRTLGLSFSKSPHVPSGLVGFADSTWGSDVSSRRSRTGYLFRLNGHLVSWQSKLQPTVALSTCEAEYMALSSAVQESSFLLQLIASVGFHPIRTALIHQDNKGTLDLAKNPRIKSRTKHIDIKHHFLREKLASGQICLRFTPTADMQADILTKPLVVAEFLRQRDSMGMLEFALNS